MRVAEPVGERDGLYHRGRRLKKGIIGQKSFDIKSSEYVEETVELFSCW